MPNPPCDPCARCGYPDTQMLRLGREGLRPELCARCYWRTEAEEAQAALAVIQRRTARHSLAKDLGSAVEGDAVILTRLQQERDQAVAALRVIGLTTEDVAAAIAVVPGAHLPTLLTEDLVLEAVDAWNNTPIGAHGHLISNRFEHNQMRSALRVLVSAVHRLLEVACSASKKGPVRERRYEPRKT